MAKRRRVKRRRNPGDWGAAINAIAPAFVGIGAVAAAEFLPTVIGRIAPSLVAGPIAGAPSDARLARAGVAVGAVEAAAGVLLAAYSQRWRAYGAALAGGGILGGASQYRAIGAAEQTDKQLVSEVPKP